MKHVAHKPNTDSPQKPWTKPGYRALDFRLRDVRLEVVGTPDDGLDVGLKMRS